MAEIAGNSTALFSKQQQKQVLRKFIQITLGRLERIRADLSATQALFLDALPILLHCNHAKLPGFVSDYAPAGLCQYQPSGAEVQKLLGLVPDLKAQQLHNSKNQLLGLYISGDCGTIVQTAKQNMMVWLCHSDNLAANELALLNRKCLLIADWAKSLDLAVDFRLFDSRFNLPEPHCHVRCLALDWFYRSSVLVAGKMPLWWLVPPEEEPRYAQFASLLRHKNYVSDEEVLDFGDVNSVPAEEYLRTGIELLSDIDKQPYEIGIKQALSEIYIHQQAQIPLLSSAYKAAVYQGKTQLDDLDPYILVYQTIENYLQGRGENNRLELIRRCFYFQVGQQLSQHQSNPNWQYKLMQQLAKRWGWNKDKLKTLDNRPQWKADIVKKEGLELVRELGNNYRFLSEFTRANKDQLSAVLLDEMHLLGRKLHSWYERKAGKVERINLALSENLLEKNLYFCQVKHRLQTVWAVYAEPINQRNSSSALPLRRHESLVELLAWCHLNGICQSQTTLHVVDGDHQLNSTELSQLYERIEQALPTNSALLKPDNAEFDQLARPCQVHIFINVAVNTQQKGNKKDGKINSLTTVFDYHEWRNNSIVNLETLTINNWGEVVCKTYSGSIALLNCIRDYMQSVPPLAAVSPPKPHFHCFSSNQCAAIKARLEELFTDLVACYYSSRLPANTRYVLQMKNQFFIIQYANHKTSFKGARSEDELIRRLAQPQLHYSPIMFDRYALSQSALAAICTTMKKDSLQIYYQDLQNGTANVYIIDEKGSLYTRSYPFSSQQNLLKPIDTFLQSTLYRQSVSQSLANQDFDKHDHRYIETDVLYYQIVCQEGQPTKVLATQLDKQLTDQRYFNVQAIAEAGPNNKPIFTIYCDQQEFSSVDWSDGLYPAIARFIMSRRKSGGTYPCYISDLDLSGVGASDGSHNAQTIDYLHYQEMIENGINEALQRQ